MLRLKTPIRLGDRTYEGMAVVKAELDFRSRRIVFWLGLVDEHEDCLIVGTLQGQDATQQLLAPVVVSTGEVHDPGGDDPAVGSVLTALQGAFETLEYLLLANQKIQDLVFELGDVRFPLDAQFIACPTKPFRTRVHKPAQKMIGQGGPSMRTLAELQEASCQWYQDVKQEYERVRDLPPDQRPGDLGAYARNGGPTSKPQKMCAFRVQDILTACQQGNVQGARTAAVQARHAVENWIGQTVGYIRDGMMPGAYAEQYFGLGISAATILAASSDTAAKEAMWSVAAAAGPQDPIQPVALSILADLYQRLAGSTVCDGQGA